VSQTQELVDSFIPV